MWVSQPDAEESRNGDVVTAGQENPEQIWGFGKATVEFVAGTGGFCINGWSCYTIHLLSKKAIYHDHRFTGWALTLWRWEGPDKPVCGGLRHVKPRPDIKMNRIFSKPLPLP